MVKEDDIALWVLKIIIVMQGCFLIGVTACIFVYYARKVKKFSLMQVHIASVSLSHWLLIIATMRTMWKGLYRLTDVWFFIVFLAYVLSNFALFVMYIRLKEELRDLRAAQTDE